VNVALAPIGALIWGYEKIHDWLVPELEARLARVPPERIGIPAPTISGPAIEALRFAGTDETLRDLYANLLATAMDGDTARSAHPGFVEIIKQLTPDEARLLAHLDGLPAPQLATITVKIVVPPDQGTGEMTMLERFTTLGDEAGCVFPDLSRNYLENLARLGLLELDATRYWTSAPGNEKYAQLEAHPTVAQLKAQIDALEGRSTVIQKGIVQLTAYGQQFIEAVVRDRSKSLGGASEQRSDDEGDQKTPAEDETPADR
jgi:Abortive infection alpha